MKRSFLRTLTLMVAGGMLLGACASGKPGQAPAAGSGASSPAPASTESQVTVAHYFSDSLGEQAMANLYKEFEAANPGVKVVDDKMGHEDFKTAILVALAGKNPPDLFSYWAGAKTQFIVDNGSVRQLDDWWKANNLDSVFPPGLQKAAAEYSGHKYLLPLDYHYVAMFYNPKVMQKVGVTQMPQTWDDLLALADKLKSAGITPFAVGSKNRWPAQFWFDYLLLRTAGPDYRAKLMAGKASYTDPEVQRVMKMWGDLLAKGYFVPNANAYDWTDAADQVANGKAAMTLMGTWITGYWNGNKLVPGTDYDFFPFPVIDKNVPVAALGPVDGFAISAKAQHPEAAQKMLLFYSQPQVQAEWAKGQGALAPNTKVDSGIYNSVMLKAQQEVAKAATFAFNYDLATPPEMSDAGLNMFAQFMDKPDGYMDYLQQVQAQADKVFKK